MTRATTRISCFQHSEGRGQARLAAEGAVAFHQSKGDGNGVSGVNFRHTRSNEQAYGPLDMTKREQMTYFQLRTNLFPSFDLCVSCLLPELVHQFGV